MSGIPLRTATHGEKSTLDNHYGSLLASACPGLRAGGRLTTFCLPTAGPPRRAISVGHHVGRREKAVQQGTAAIGTYW
jgi:hypothetical protein